MNCSGIEFIVCLRQRELPHAMYITIVGGLEGRFSCQQGGLGEGNRMVFLVWVDGSSPAPTAVRVEPMVIAEPEMVDWGVRQLH